MRFEMLEIELKSKNTISMHICQHANLIVLLRRIWYSGIHTCSFTFQHGTCTCLRYIINHHVLKVKPKQLYLCKWQCVNLVIYNFFVLFL